MSYYIDCLAQWWNQISYTTWMYFALFLPVTMLAYQLAGRKGRRVVLLAASWVFFLSLSGFLLVANIATSVFVWFAGNRLDSINSDETTDRKQKTKKKEEYSCCRS